MPFARDDLAIVMRTFWPTSPVVGEGMMCVAEEIALKYTCRVITQNQSNLSQALRESGRGVGVEFSSIYALSSSSSKIFMRILDLLWFTLAVSFALIIRRPRIVYVATDPPLLVPMIVALYAKLFSAKYVYHVQDIHPEASAVVFPILKVSIFRYIYRFFRWIDGHVVESATALITLTPEMADSLARRGGRSLLQIRYVNNPAAQMSQDKFSLHYDYSFVGNAGRLQCLPLIIGAIKRHLDEGGKKRFAFAGAGVMAGDLDKLANDYPENVYFFGKVPVEKATRITMESRWALLPIEDEVCHYAFPSKAATYAFAGKSILAICGEATSVGRWVVKNRLGKVLPPNEKKICEFFADEDERSNIVCKGSVVAKARLDIAAEISVEQFVNGVVSILFDVANANGDVLK